VSPGDCSAYDDPVTRISVGPVPSASALAFVTQARKQLADVDNAAVLASALTPDLVEAFRGYLDEWDRAAHAGPEMGWSVEVDADYLEFAVNGLFQIVRHLEETGDLTIGPDDERLPFYRALVSGLIHALESEDITNFEYAEQLRDDWPGLGSVD
jgi:hypothetical protein